ncbi:MAG: hypothetical protein GSR77_06300 [Desulfurococcales archaeon]|nr:hypothetical protein [Desulfurococcales archaeon]
MTKNLGPLMIMLLMSLSLVPATSITTNSQFSPIAGFQFSSIGGIVSTMLTPSNYSVKLYLENGCMRPVVRLGINPFLLTMLDNSSIMVTSSVENNTLVLNGNLVLSHDFIAVLANDTNMKYNISYEFAAGSQYREKGIVYLSLANSSSHIMLEGYYNITGNLYNVVLQSELRITGFGGYFETVDEYLSNSSQVSLLVEQLENIFNVRITEIEARKINNTYYIVSIKASLYAWPTIPPNITSGSGEEAMILSNGTVMITVNDTIFGEFRTIDDYLSALKFVGHISMLSGTRIPILLGLDYSGGVESSQLKNLLLCDNSELSIEKNESFLEIKLPSVTTENRACNDTIRVLSNALLLLGIPSDTPVNLYCRNHSITRNYSLSKLECACTGASTSIISESYPMTTSEETVNTVTTITTISKSKNTLYVMIGIVIVILLGIVSFFKRQ